MIVEFLEVGHEKRTWQSEIQGCDLRGALPAIEREARRMGGLTSSHLTVRLSRLTGEGVIYVGFTHPVGRVRLLTGVNGG